MAEWWTRTNVSVREDSHGRRLAVNLTAGLFDHLPERLKRLWWVCPLYEIVLYYKKHNPLTLFSHHTLWLHSLTSFLKLSASTWLKASFLLKSLFSVKIINKYFSVSSSRKAKVGMTAVWPVRPYSTACQKEAEPPLAECIACATLNVTLWHFRN